MNVISKLRRFWYKTLPKRNRLLSTHTKSLFGTPSPEEIRTPVERCEPARIVAVCGHCGFDQTPFTASYNPEVAKTKIHIEQQYRMKLYHPVKYHGKVYNKHLSYIGVELIDRITNNSEPYTCPCCNTSFETCTFYKNSKIVFLIFI